MTAYSSAPVLLNVFLAVPAVLLLLPLTPPQRVSNGSATKDKQAKKSDRSVRHTTDGTASARELPIRPFLTNYRGSMMIVTCLAILAVDFPVFPRRFAKVETWGTSLMDLGVGSFVFSAGVVSARAVLKGKPSTGHGRGDRFPARFLRALRHSVPLLVLGLVRLYSVKGLDYAEHVTEYGVHWNFFFTLALLPPFVEISDTATRHAIKSYDLLALFLAIMYEVVLDNTGLLRYILVSPRGPDLLSKNREGVFSFIGYLAIFLAGRGTGLLVVDFVEPVSKGPKHFDPVAATKKERGIVLYRLAKRAAIWTLLFWTSTSFYVFNLNVSRRLANLPYVLWVIAFNNIQILLFGLVEHVGPQFSYEKWHAEAVSQASSRIIRVFNQNGLVIFLVANLLTGLVNLTVNTLDMGNLGAMALLIVYAATLTAFALALSASGIKIKI